MTPTMMLRSLVDSRFESISMRRRSGRGPSWLPSAAKDGGSDEDGDCGAGAGATVTGAAEESRGNRDGSGIYIAPPGVNAIVPATQRLPGSRRLPAQ